MQKRRYAKALEATFTRDTLVLGSPIYISYVTVQTKILLDRLYALLKIEEKTRILPGKNIMENIAQIFKWAFNMEVRAVFGDNNLKKERAIK